MIELHDIKIVHVEASSRCNSHCPMCSRYTADGLVQPDLIEQDLSPAIFYKLFTPEFTSQLDHVYFSGVYGDPCLNKDLPEFVNYLIDNGCSSVSIDTNGGYRGEEWWAKLAIPKVLINFALDGASDTSLEQYRVNVNYTKVLNNLKAYVAAGGNAQWNFIVFKHNEHELDLASQIAQELGVKFRVKVTQKFKQNKNFKVMVNGVYSHTLLPPENEKYRHPNIGNKEHVPQSFFKFNVDNYSSLNKNQIVCKTQERKDVFLSASGMLFPCCYVGTYTHDSPGSYQFNLLYNKDDFSLSQYTVDEILNKFNDISAKWKSTIAEGNLITCLHTCGNKENTTLYHTATLNKENILKEKYD
jgi:MoaA/NifB/PqqE/SkfB family radical SAM enzyme